MPQRSREQEAGFLYEQGAKAVRTGGHELSMLAGHLTLMIRGTVTYRGPLWPVRVVPPEGKKIRLDRFEDYLRKPMREGLGLPSLHFLRQVLEATPSNGGEALELVREELTKEHVDLDAVADREQAKTVPELPQAMTPNEAGAKGGRGKKASYNITSFKDDKGTSVSYTLGRLKRDHPALADRVVNGELSANAAAIEAGWRKRLTSYEQILKLLPRLTATERKKLRKELD